MSVCLKNASYFLTFFEKTFLIVSQWGQKRVSGWHRAIWLITNWQRDIRMTLCLVDAVFTLSFPNSPLASESFLLFVWVDPLLQKDIIKYKPISIKDSPWLMLLRLHAIWVKGISMTQCLIDVAMTLSFFNSQLVFESFLYFLFGLTRCLSVSQMPILLSHPFLKKLVSY